MTNSTASMSAPGCRQSSHLVRFSFRHSAIRADMSQGALFGFGCVIFFIVGTGAFLFAMSTLREAVDRERTGTR